MTGSEMAVSFAVNGAPVNVLVEPRRSLLDCLRDDLGLRGTHVGCEHGVCGCCNVLLDGSLVRSCLILACQVNGANVRTIEGVATGETLTPLQEAFCAHHALQCGYCTPGILMNLLALIEEDPNPNDEALIDALSGNLCRCTGYQQIVEASKSAIRQITTQQGVS